MTPSNGLPEGFQQKLDETTQDAALHIAYWRMLEQEDVPPDIARAMVVAYIQSKNVAKLRVDLPPEERDSWQG